MKSSFVKRITRLQETKSSYMDENHAFVSAEEFHDNIATEIAHKVNWAVEQDMSLTAPLNVEER